MYRKQIALLFLLYLLSSNLFLLGPYLSKLFIDKALIDKNMAKFLNLSIWGGILFLFDTSLKIAGDIVKNKTAIRLKLKFNNMLIKKLYSLDLSFFQSKSVGENVYRLSDAENIAGFILEDCPNFLADIFKLLIVFCIAFYINARMAGLLVVLSPLFIIHSVYLRRKIRPISEKLWEYNALLSKKIYEALSKILIIKAFGLEFYERHAYLRLWIENMRYKIKSFRWVIISSLSSSVLSKAAYGVIALYGGWLILKENMSLGSYAAVMLYLNQLRGLISSLSNNFVSFSHKAVSLNKFFEVMNAQSGIREVANAKVLKDIKGDIQFQDVWFGYNGKPVIKGLSFRIPSRSWVAIAGPSGCGKTTIINLIIRLCDPQRGNTYIDGIDLKSISLRSLRKEVSIAAQQPFLFDASVRENIGYGLRAVSEDKIKEAAKIAHIHDFIIQLPQGYNTLIGEDACYLSQGLKQRIAIARAILREPYLLILDEATSSIDSFTEEKIFNALREKRQNLSTIVISHRLFSIKDADRIYFLKEGGSLEEGTHSQLLSRSSSYREFFHNQPVS